MAEVVTIVRPYAVAAFKLAKEKNALVHWSEMLGFAAAIAADATMQAYIENPEVTSAQLEKTFLDIAGDRLDEAGKNMIRLLVEYDRLGLLPSLAAAYEELKAAGEGVLEGEITAAAKTNKRTPVVLSSINYFWTGAVELLTINAGSTLNTDGTSLSGCFNCSRSVSAARLPISKSGWRIVVKAGL